MTDIRAALAQVLTDHGIAPNQNGFHGWRCEHPDRYPDYCHCVPDLLDALVAALAAASPEPERLPGDCTKPGCLMSRHPAHDEPVCGCGQVRNARHVGNEDCTPASPEPVGFPAAGPGDDEHAPAAPTAEALRDPAALADAMGRHHAKEHSASSSLGICGPWCAPAILAALEQGR